MLMDLKECRFFIQPGITDLRNAINGLTVLVQNEMKNDPFSKSLFLFCNRQRKILKIVYWDKNGFCLWQKRLEKHKFPWPSTKEEAMEESFDELSMLLSGIDFSKSHKELTYSRI